MGTHGPVFPPVLSLNHMSWHPSSLEPHKSGSTHQLMWHILRGAWMVVGMGCVISIVLACTCRPYCAYLHALRWPPQTCTHPCLHLLCLPKRIMLAWMCRALLHSLHVMDASCSPAPVTLTQTCCTHPHLLLAPTLICPCMHQHSFILACTHPCLFLCAPDCTCSHL